MIKKTDSFVANGRVNDVYTLRNQNGYEVDICTYGARITRIWAADRDGVFDDIIVGCATPEDYYNKGVSYYGATIGRYGNRIGGAQFPINGKEYFLEANDGKNCLHGGSTASFDRTIWAAEIAGEKLAMKHVSADGAGGFPGKMEVQVCFSLTDANELIIEYFAKCDQDTVCNLTNHAYFNLGCRETVLDHELMIKSRRMTKIDKELIPHGEYEEIDGTPYSFYPAKLLGKDMFSSAEMIQYCGGYDFNYCLERETERGLELCATVYDEVSGRKMDCFTTLPGVQLYTSNTIEGFIGKKAYKNHAALCLETQGYPNSPNCPEYPSTLLRAGEEYRETTVYQFSVKK